MKTICLLSLLCLALLPANPSLAQEVDFTRDIRPILSDKCFACHGNDEETRESGLRLDVREDAVDMDALAPGSLDDSNAWQRIISDDDDEVMPPPHLHKPLSDDEKEKIRLWIEQGAVYEAHWAYRKLEKPEVKMAKVGESPIDALIRRSLAEHELKPTPPADRATLIRRLTLDLTGLPPTLDEITNFINDESPDAYEELVDRLLADKAFGERMAVFWLDLVRYADTVGYHADNFMEVSAYRDYVINSFNANKPFDEFTIEQLAGDLLPNATTEQKIASGYNRLLQTTEEGGAQAKEYIAIYAADRVRNVSGVWMGQTMGCAQCHDHKYDPITAKDFYAMSAFFADIKEVAVGKRVKNLTIFTDEEKAKLAELENDLATAGKEETDYKKDSPSRKKAQAVWEKELLTNANNGNVEWIIPELSNIKVSKGGKLKELGDGSFLSSGKNLDHGDYQFELTSNQKISAIRVEALPDESFTHKNGLSRGNGNFILTSFEVKVDGKPRKIASATADYEQQDWPAAHAIDDDEKSGWAISGHIKREGRRVIIFKLEEPIDLSVADAGKIEVAMRHQSKHTQHIIGRFRVSVPASNDADATLSFDGETRLPDKFLTLVSIPDEKRSEEQRNQIGEQFLQQSEELIAIQERKTNLETAIKTIRDGARTTLIAESMATPMETKIRNRGDWMDESGEVVQPAVPEFLPSSFDGVDRRLNRLDLAKWIVEPANPLTARTFVNRLWKVFYGRGLSNNLDDLGGQGEPPTHPELLDWLAAEFQEKWDIKRTVKLLVMTDTYRQSSVTARAVVENDPGNLWYARQGRWRIDAEFVRDTALQLGGLLNEDQIGGVSVKPYQPEGYWQHLNFPKRKWEHDKGTKIYRKSLYTFWCRSFLHPSMLAFDAPTREECVASRARSNIPQQALVLLNDPIFVEASRGFGIRMMQMQGDTRKTISRGWREASGRKPTDDEINLLVELFESQRKRYSEASEEAKAFLAIGESEIHDDIDVRELAAWTQVARAMMNAYETISRH